MHAARQTSAFRLGVTGDLEDAADRIGSYDAGPGYVAALLHRKAEILGRVGKENDGRGPAASHHIAAFHANRERFADSNGRPTDSLGLIAAGRAISAAGEKIRRVRDNRCIVPAFFEITLCSCLEVSSHLHLLQI